MISETKTRGLGIEDLIGGKRDEVLRLADKHGATNVRVFGSVARGDARPDSDIDLLVDWEYDRLSFWGGAGLGIELQGLLGCEVDIVSAKWLNPLLRDRILQEAVLL